MSLSDKVTMKFASAQPIGGWEDFLKDGEGFLRTAVGAHEKQKKVFTPEILYNLIAMAIEKFVMAALMRHGTLPYNHTIKDLVEAMEKTFPGAIDDLKEALIKMDGYQDICDLDGFRITPPDMEEIPGMLEIGQKLKRMAAEEQDV